jgi:hypothetical protein
MMQLAHLEYPLPQGSVPAVGATRDAAFRFIKIVTAGEHYLHIGWREKNSGVQATAFDVSQSRAPLERVANACGTTLDKPVPGLETPVPQH